MQNNFIATINIISASYFNKFARDMVLPIIPILAGYYDTVNIEISIAIYFLGIALSRIVFSYYAGKANVRFLFFLMHAVFILATISIIVTDSFAMYLTARFMQGLSIACLPLIIRTILVTACGLSTSIKLYSRVSLLLAWAPAVATTFAGFLLVYIGAKSIFYTLIVVAVVNLSLTLTNKNIVKYDFYNKHDFLTSYNQIIHDKRFWQLSVPYIATFAVFAIYLTMSPRILLVNANMPAEIYGSLFFVIIAGNVLGKFIVTFVIDSFRVEKIVYYASLLFLSSAINIYFVIDYIDSNLVIVFCTAVIFLFQGVLSIVIKNKVAILIPALKTMTLGVLAAFESITSTVISLLCVMLPASWNTMYSLIICLGVIAVTVAFNQQRLIKKVMN